MSKRRKFVACTILAVTILFRLATANCFVQLARATEAENAAASGIQELQSWYIPKTGLYETTGWWNAANAITVLSDYSQLTHARKYRPTLAHTFKVAQLTSSHFINKFYDDEGWWALAWIDTYDLTGDPKYLAMAQVVFEDMARGWSDDVCGGGIWWSKDHDYKNAIANELFLSVAAHLANRISDPERKAAYLSWASREWSWFRSSGMINAKNLINDGLVSDHPSSMRQQSENDLVLQSGRHPRRPDRTIESQQRSLAFADCQCDCYCDSARAYG